MIERRKREVIDMVERTLFTATADSHAPETPNRH
jgi:hypothetical protein